MRKIMLAVMAALLFAPAQTASVSNEEISDSNIIPAATDEIRLVMDSDKRDLVGQGEHYDIRSSDWKVKLFDLTRDGIVDRLELQYSNDNEWWTLMFGADQMPGNILVGTYLDAERAAFATAGHPGLDVFGSGRGCDQVKGSFKVLDARFDTSGVPWRIVGFAVQFEQRCKSSDGSLRGSFYFNSPVPGIDKVKYKGKKMTVIGSNFDGVARLLVDEREVTLSSQSDTELLGKVKLSKGKHQVIVLNEGDIRSLPFEIKVP